MMYLRKKNLLFSFTIVSNFCQYLNTLNVKQFRVFYGANLSLIMFRLAYLPSLKKTLIKYIFFKLWGEKR